MYKRFNEDGTCQEAISREYLDTNPTVDCKYRFDETRLILTEIKVHGVPSCNPKSGIYEVKVLGEDKIEFIKVQDSCRLRVRSMAAEHKRVP
jgi:hypothetical protein